MIQPTSSHQRGESLLGLLLGLALVLGLLAVALRQADVQWRALQRLQQQSQMQQDLRWLIERIAQDLRNAQYVGDAWKNRILQTPDPFSDDDQDLAITGDQILWTSDNNGDGLFSNECFSYRLNRSTGEVQRRKGCNSWEAITDPQVMWVTGLTWQLQCQRQGPWVARSMRWTLTLRADPSQDQPQWTLSRRVGLRNPVPAKPWPGVCGAEP